MNILITGVAGFIGFSAADYFLKNKKNLIFGIDNLDDYYSIKYKKYRLSHLLKNKNFKFKKIDISKKKELKKYFLNKKFDVVMHFAAQAGVRYSLKNPSKYIKVNKEGFENIMNSIIDYNYTKKIIYASSSSVYGDTQKLPTPELEKTKPRNVYAKTKIENEILAKKYKKKYNINIIGLRFFTVYGEWGRPDMFLFKLLKSYRKNEKFYLNNFGNHNRDFTYIGDIKIILKELIKKNFFEYDILNICGSNPINIQNVFNQFIRNYNFKKFELIKKNKADVLNTHGDNKLLKKFIKFKKFTPFKKGFEKTIKWYFKNKIHKF